MHSYLQMGLLFLVVLNLNLPCTASGCLRSDDSCRSLQPEADALAQALEEEDTHGDSTHVQLLQVSRRAVKHQKRSSRFVLVSGNSEDVASDPYYDLLKANKEWAAESLGMKFEHYWSEDLVPKKVDPIFATPFMVKEAMRSNGEADFIIFMESQNSWFNPQLLFKKDEGQLMSDIAEQIPADKHFVFSPVTSLSSSVFIVRNSKIGESIIDMWIKVVSGSDAPRCRPWDAAALYDVFLKMVSQQSGLTQVPYDCQASCDEPNGCVNKFEDILKTWKMDSFPAGLANDKVPIFHVLTASDKGQSGIPRLMCMRCFTYDKPTSALTADLGFTIVTPGEESLVLDVPWLINFAGDVYGPTVMPDTFGLLECQQLPTRSTLEAVVIGVPFGGAKSIRNYLGAHPDVVLPNIKEVNYFKTASRLNDVWQFYQAGLNRSRAKGLGVTGFRDWIEETCKQYLELLPEEAGKLTFDVSSDYYFNYWAAEWIRNMFPRMKIIISLRDPTDRAYSEWLAFNGTEGREGEMQNATTFSEALDFYEHTFQDCQHTWQNFDLSVDGAVRDTLHPPFENCVNMKYGEHEVSRSLYIAYFQAWLGNFPKNQMHIVDFNDLTKDSLSVMESIWEFLGHTLSLTKAAPFLDLGSHGVDPEDVVVFDGRTSAKGFAESCEFYAQYNTQLATVVNMTFNWCKYEAGSEKGRENWIVKSEFAPDVELLSHEQFMCRGLTTKGCEAYYHRLHGHGWVDGKYCEFSAGRPELQLPKPNVEKAPCAESNATAPSPAAVSTTDPLLESKLRESREVDSKSRAHFPKALPMVFFVAWFLPITAL